MLPGIPMACLGLVVTAVLSASCGGKPFRADGAAGSAGQAESGGGATEPLAGSASFPDGGAGLSDGGTGPSTGGTAAGGAGAVGAAGDTSTGGTAADPSCSELGGAVFREHCYVDATEDSEFQPQAVKRCGSRATQAFPHGHLLVLNSADEQAFVLKEFLAQFLDVSDAWLGLNCDALAHPDVTDCYCTGCSSELKAAKRQAWQWMDESTSTFGWVNGNPNEASRCAALAYNSDITAWGWVDRPCAMNHSQIADHPTHTYRTICELEP